MSSDKQRNKAAIRQREHMKEARARVEERAAAEAARAGHPPRAPAAGPWKIAEVRQAISDAFARFPADGISVRMLVFKDRTMNLPGFQSGGEPLKASPPEAVASGAVAKRNGHSIMYVPAMRHFVVVWHDTDKRMVFTRAVHETNVHSWEPLAEPEEQAAVAA